MDASPALIDGFFAISSRAHGEPIESLTPTRWKAVLPTLFNVLDAIRCVDLSDFEGRTRCCMIQIGLDHQAYNAHTGRLDDLAAVTERLLPLLD